MITKKYYKLIRVSYADEGYFCLTNVGNSVGTVKIDNPSGSSGGAQPNCEYSTDGVTWNSYTTRGIEINVDPNSNIYWRYAGSGGTLGDSNVFYFDFDCYASGNLMSLYEKTNFASYTGNWDASRLFENQTHLLRADFNLGAQTTIPQRGLYGIFHGCTSLTTAPDLSNITTLENYAMGNMFTGCASLTTSPHLENITTAGYGSLFYTFQGCSLLNTIYAPTITQNQDVTSGWVFNVAASGNFYVYSNVADSWTTSSNDGIPYGWTKVTL